MRSRENLSKAGVLAFQRGGELPDLAFSGFAYFDDAVVFGEKQFRRWKLSEAGRIEDGRFVIAYKDTTPSRFVIRTDSAGQDLVFYYTNQDDWAVSTSFLDLVDTLKSRGISLSQNIAATATGLIPHSSTQHLISNHTMINEIKVLPLGHQIEITGSRFAISRRGSRSVYDSYEEALLAFWKFRLTGTTSISTLTAEICLA